MTEKELIDYYTRTRVGSEKKITSVEWVADLPRSGAGKLLCAQAKNMCVPLAEEGFADDNAGQVPTVGARRIVNAKRCCQQRRFDSAGGPGAHEMDH